VFWVVAVLIAAAAQTGRNAAQAGLTRSIGTTGATLVRFVFGLPFALAFLLAVVLWEGRPPPVPGVEALGFLVLGAVAQILATALMLVTMKSASFATVTAWLKTEPVVLALAGWVVLGEAPGWAALAAIAVATLGVVLLSPRPAALLSSEARPVATGIASAALFALAAIGFRGGITGLAGDGFVLRAATALAISLTVQSALMVLWMLAFNRAALWATFRLWRQSLVAGFLGAFASQFWFFGFALTSAVNVRTLGLVDVLFAQGVQRFAFGQRSTKRQLLGMALVVAGVAALLRLHV